MRYPVEPRNQAGVIAVILGVLALATCWLLIGVPLGIAALITGDIARRRAGRGEATNPKAATAGFVLGAVAIVAGLLAIGYYAWLDAQNPGSFQRCLDNPATNNC
jgi:ABC-type phosphate transport system permease subunit